MRTVRATIGLSVAVMFAVAACSSDDASTPDTAVDPTPHIIGEPVTPADNDDLWLPAIFEEAPLVDPEWFTTVHYLDGVYVGITERDTVLEFRAIDETGTELWVAERPLSCSGYTLTRDSSGRTLAVLTDTQPGEESLVALTASAYDLHSGQLVWGPIGVPGPYQGPGLVFAEPSDSPISEGQPRVALSPDTGEVAVSESDQDTAYVIGEYNGTILWADSVYLTASDGTGDVLWQTALEEHGWHASALTGSHERLKVDGVTVLGTAPGSGSLIDLATGEVLSDGVQDVAVDAMTGVIVTLAGNELEAHDITGEHIWAASVTEDTTIAVAGGVYVYLRDGDAIRVHNSLTGQVAEAYPPDGTGIITVPMHITETGAGLLNDGSGRLIATRPPLP